MYDEFISLRVDRKTKFFLSEAKVSRRDILRLGLDQYYKENPKLKLEVDMKFTKHERKYLEKEINNNKFEAEKLEREALNMTLSMRGIKQFLKSRSIENMEEFLKSVFEIKKIIDLREGLEHVKNGEFALQSLACDMDTDLFKKACIDLLKKYDI